MSPGPLLFRACRADPCHPAWPAVARAETAPRRDDAAPAGRLRAPLLLSATATCLAALLVYLGPPGTDFAAHAYQTALFSAHGFVLWNNLWYAGRYSFVTYSLLYYPLASLFGIRLLAVGCVAVSVLAFSLLTGRRWGRAARWSNRSAALVLPAFVLSAAFPFLLGTTLSLLAVLALRDGRRPTFAVLCGLTAAASPLAFLFLALVVLGTWLGDGRPRREVVEAATILAAVLVGLVVLATAFPSDARYPFPAASLLGSLVFSSTLVGLTWRVRAARSVRFVALLNGAACVSAFFLSSEVGEGMTRLRFVALPLTLLALAIRGWKPWGLAAVSVIAAGYWNVAPLVTSFANGIEDPSAEARYWRPAIDFLRANLPPGSRVEVVDTQRHWAAAYLPSAGIPLVRGWFRQDDFPQNEILYDHLGAAAYRRWLRGLAARYVVLTDVTPDYSAQSEARLLRSGRSGLRLVLHRRHVEIFAVPHPGALVSGPGSAMVTRLGHDRVAFQISRAGRYRVAVRYSPYWTAAGACVTAGADGMLRVSVARPGPVILRFSVGIPAMMRTLVGTSPRCRGRP